MIDKKMIIDPDHLSVRARKQLLTSSRRRSYSGVVSSHSLEHAGRVSRGSTSSAASSRRTRAPRRASSRQWREALKPMRDKRFYFGLRLGRRHERLRRAGRRRAAGENPVTYPFKSFDGKVTVDQQQERRSASTTSTTTASPTTASIPTGSRTCASSRATRSSTTSARGAEAYLQMWERADGIPTGCRPAKAKLTRRGLAGARLGVSTARAAAARGPAEAARRARRGATACDEGKLVAALTPAGRVALRRLDRARPQGARDPRRG